MEDHAVVEALSALAHQSRLAVFRLLVPEGPDGLPAGEIGKRLGIPANALSFHMTRLRHAGLVTVRRNGQHMIYAAAYEGMQSLVSFLTESCCRNGPQGCSSVCPETSSGQTDKRRDRKMAEIAGRS